MKKALVAYFSASGVTQRLAKTVAEAAGVPVHCFSIYDMTLSAAKKLLEIDE